MSIHRDLRVRREKLGITQGEVAEAVGITRSQIANIEAGRSNTPFATLEQIAGYLDCSVVIRPNEASLMMSANGRQKIGEVRDALRRLGALVDSI